MKIWSNQFHDGDYLSSHYAAGAIGVDGFAPNINPPLTWDNVPEGTQSFVLVCHDPDAPAVRDHVNKADREIPDNTPRKTFFHWLLIDLPAHIRKIEEGEYSNGFVVKGKHMPIAAHASRQGINDYTAWSSNDPEMAGQYFGYDGPYPPFNDCIPHRYIFTVYALGVDKVALPEGFTGNDLTAVLDEMQKQGMILAKASITGLYTMNPRLARLTQKGNA